MKISWTPTARRTYLNILDYLAENWTVKEVSSFNDKVENILNQITSNPEMFQASGKKKNLRKAVISRHNTLYYRIKPGKEELELITFWDNRRNPYENRYQEY